jgi:hypothetical protein
MRPLASSGISLKILKRAVTSKVKVLLTDGMRRPVSGRDAVRSQVIDVLEAQEIKETGNEED